MNKLSILLVGALLGGAGVSLAADPAPVAAATAPAELISQADLLARLEKKDAGLVVLDVRTPEEFAAGHVPGARNVSHDQLPAKLAELASLKDKEVVLYCRSGRRTALAEQTLRGAGFTRLRHLEGDWLAWQAEQKPVETN
jgi:phage shock protein E